MDIGEIILESLPFIIPMGLAFGGVMFFLPSRKSLNIYFITIWGLLVATFLIFLFGGGRNVNTTGAAVVLVLILVITAILAILIVPAYFGARYRLGQEAKTLAEMGWNLINENKKEEARQIFEKALRKKPKLERALSGLEQLKS